MSNFAWKNQTNLLEIRFRMECRVMKKQGCDYHDGKYDDNCYDCSVIEEWFPTEFRHDLLHMIDKKGYINENLRVCSNSLRVDNTCVQKQVQDLVVQMAKK